MIIDIEKYNEFADELKKLTHNFYQWTKGEMRISDKNLEFIASNAEKNLGRDSGWKYNSHKSGKDLIIFGEPVSCKSATLNKNQFKISSYRLTNCVTIEDFKTEISKRDNTYKYHLLCLTQELSDRHIVRWGFVDKSKTDISSVDFNMVYNKKKNKPSLLESKDKKYKIVFSCSNQLWIYLKYSDLQVICEYEFILKNNLSHQMKLF